MYLQNDSLYKKAIYNLVKEQAFSMKSLAII